jgi:hypothetical protein
MDTIEPRFVIHTAVTAEMDEMITEAQRRLMCLTRADTVRRLLMEGLRSVRDDTARAE